MLIRQEKSGDCISFFTPFTPLVSLSNIIFQMKYIPVYYIYRYQYV